MDSRTSGPEDAPFLWEIAGIRRSDGHIGGRQVIMMLAVDPEGGVSPARPMRFSVDQARKIATHLKEMANHAEETA